MLGVCGSGLCCLYVVVAWVGVCVCEGECWVVLGFFGVGLGGFRCVYWCVCVCVSECDRKNNLCTPSSHAHLHNGQAPALGAEGG